MENNTADHSAHSAWRCQYPIVFAPKYRRKVIYGQLKPDIGYSLRKLCSVIGRGAAWQHVRMSKEAQLSYPSAVYKFDLEAYANTR